MKNPLRLAKYLFYLDAVLGIISIGGAALYGAAYSSKSLWAAFLPIFLPFSALWVLFCYGAYRGLTGPNVFAKLMFWLFVLGHAIAFPVGTAIAGVAVWLWREASPRSVGTRGGIVAQKQVPGDVPAAPSARQGRL